MASATPNPRYEEITVAGSGHAAVLERTEDVGRLVSAFLDEISAAGAAGSLGATQF